MIDGLRLALTTLTVLPLRAGRIDRSVAAVAMAFAPVVGALLGLALAAIRAGLAGLGAGAPVAAAVTVAAGVLLTRGLHLDGLADTVDALGSYRSGAAALEIMKKPDIGPFGVAAVTLTLLVQAAALTEVSAGGIVVAWAAGRLGITVACRWPAARPDGLGALVAGTVPAKVAVVLAVTVAAAALAAAGWLGPVAVGTALLVVLLLLRHAARRFGGITGDVLGAVAELGTTVALLTLTVSAPTW